tara:strand:+ start:1071 stop:2483 length:1413 start_codon:yes stop_codon:yes gene_type:complete
VLLFKNTYLSKKTTLETFTASITTVQYDNLSPYNINLSDTLSSSECENAGNDIYNKLKVVLTDTNYIILREKIATSTNQQNTQTPTPTKCEKLKELFCDKNYQKIKHFINIGLHDGNNIWNIEDNAQSNADNCDSNTLNKEIICENMSNLLDNFHIIKQGIIDCDPPDSSTRSYRSFDLNCSVISDCAVGHKLNSNLVDVTTRFKIGDTENACVPCSPGQITDTPYSCSNCVNTKPNTNKEQCVGCVDGDYTIGSCSWTCTHTRPEADFISSTTGDTKFCGTRRKQCPADSCTDKSINREYVRINVIDSKNGSNTVKCLTKSHRTSDSRADDVGLSTCSSTNKRQKFWPYAHTSPASGTHYHIKWINDTGDNDHNDEHERYLDIESKSVGYSGSDIAYTGGPFELKEDHHDDISSDQQTFRIGYAKIGSHDGANKTYIENLDGRRIFWDSSTTTVGAKSGINDNVYFTKY